MSADVAHCSHRILGTCKVDGTVVRPTPEQAEGMVVEDRRSRDRPRLHTDEHCVRQKGKCFSTAEQLPPCEHKGGFFLNLSKVHRLRPAQGASALAAGSGEGVPLLQQQQQQQVALQDTYYSSRAEALQNVESTIVELGGIFQQLAHMVRE